MPISAGSPQQPYPNMTQEQLENAPMGSVFINNTSYSGADIKLVTHIYEPAEVSNKRIAELQAELSSLETAMQQSAITQSIAEGKLASQKPGTPGYERISSQFSKKTADLDSLNKSMTSVSDEIKRLQSGKSDFSTLALADVQTISISSFRSKQAVRTLGRVYPVGYVRGQREIAGSIIFTVFNEHTLYKLIQAHPSDFDSSAFTTALLDQLPPMDITIAFANEYGQLSRMALYGVEFIDEGQTMSIEDILTENVVHYVARDYDPLRSVGSRKLDEASRLMSGFAMTKASDLIREDDYQNVKNMLDPFERFKRRSSSFL